MTTMRNRPILMMTRPLSAAQRFLAALERTLERALEQQIDTVIAPLIGIEPVAVTPRVAHLAGVVFTSENGVAQAGPMGVPGGLPAFCVGDRTAEAARGAGYDAVSADGDAEALIALILSSGTRGPLLHLRGAHARGNVAARLIAAGISCEAVVAYRQIALPLTDDALAALRGDRPVVLPLFSPRTVSIMAQNGPFVAPLHVVAISAAAARQAVAMSPHNIVRAARPTGAAMLSATAETVMALINDAPALEGRGKPG